MDADHFAFVRTDISHEREVSHFVESLIEEFAKQSFALDDAVVRVAGKIGVALFPADGDGAETLFGNAEIALRKAKAGGDRYTLFAHKMGDTIVIKTSLESRLHDAIDRQELILLYQPRTSLLTGKVTGAEALVH